MRVWKWRSTSLSTRVGELANRRPVDVAAEHDHGVVVERFVLHHRRISRISKCALTRDRHDAPRGGASCLVFLPLPSIPDSPPSRPDPPSLPGPERPRPSRVGCARPDTTAPRQGRPRRRFPLPPGSMAALPLPSTGVDAGRSGSAGDGAGGVWGSAPPAAASHPSDGRGRRVRPCTTGAPPGVRGCWRLRQTADEWRTAVRDAGDGRGAPPRRTQAVRALQDPKASRASAGAVRARPAGRFTRPGRGAGAGSTGGGGFPNASRAPDLLPGAAGPGVDAPPPRGSAYRTCSTIRRRRRARCVCGAPR